MYYLIFHSKLFSLWKQEWLFLMMAGWETYSFFYNFSFQISAPIEVSLMIS